MNRRSFLKLLGLGVGALAVPKVVIETQPEGQLYFEDPGPWATFTVTNELASDSVLAAEDIINCYEKLSGRKLWNMK